MCTSERFLGVFLSFLVVTYSFGKAVRTEFDWEPPLKGYFGCKFNRELCTSHEICIDDDLFGNCQRRTLDKFDLHRYDLDIDTLERLEQSLRQLIGSKYSWANSYTQCIVGGTLFAFRENIEFNPRTCKQIINEQTNEIITEQVLKLLGDYTDDVTNVSPGEREDGQLQPNNDFVTIHKYYKPKKSDTTYSNYQPPSDSGVGNVESQEYLKFLRSLNPEELNILQSYLALDDSVQTQNELLPTDDQPMYESPSQRQPWPATSEWTNTNGGDETDLPSDVLYRRETQLLLNLLNGDLSVDGLSDEDVERLSSYVTTLLDKPQEETKTAGYTPDEMIEDVSKPDQLRQADTQQQQRFTEQNMENLSKPVDTRDPLGDIVVKGPLHPDVKPNPIWATPSVTELTKEQPNDALLTNLAAQKKAAPPSHDVIETDKQTNKQATIRGTTEPVTSKYSLVENDYVYITFRTSIGGIQAQSVVKGFERLLGLNKGAFSIPRVDNDTVIFQVVINNEAMNASEVAALAYVHKEELEKIARTSMSEAGIGNVHRLLVDPRDSSPPKYFVLTFVLCGCVAGVLIAVVALYLVRRHSRTKQKLAQLASSADPKEASQDYQDLCRQRMQSKAQEKPEPLHIASRIGSSSEVAQSPRSSKSSTSSWSEEPVTTNMDISTGHVVLSYMEDHLKDRDRLDREWEALCAYEAEPSSCDVASSTNNARKNRYTDVLPYDHSRVVLNVNTNVSSCDYMNASSITDHDPRNPAYVATQGPLPHTVADFWQMIWEQGSVVIVMLTRLTENGMAMCHRYWPEEGSDLYHIYEVHLVSEHIWCDDFLVRSFYLKNLQTNETRTVTQFHYLTWPEGGIPATAKALLDFRRKVNKSYRGRSCPVIVHCNDGVGRTGTYILIDMVLNRMYKGAKEIDIAATLEHIRDQRISMLQTKDQFEFSLAAVAEEVHAVLKALPQ